MKRWIIGLGTFFVALLAAIFGTRRDRAPRRHIEELRRRELARIKTTRVEAAEAADERHRDRVAREVTTEDARRLIKEALDGAKR